MEPATLSATPDISLLYELSLATGNSLDSYENCRQFMRALTELKGLTSASVWRNDLNDCSSEYLLFCNYPEKAPAAKTLPGDHGIFDKFQTQCCISMLARDANFPIASLEKPAESGAVAFFRLGEFGLLKLFDVNRSEAFSKTEMEELRTVVGKFIISMSGCIAHEKLLKETESRKLMQHALYKINRRYSDLFENLYDAIIVLDRHGNVTESNRAAKKLLGFQPEDQPQVNIWKVIHPEDIPEARRNFKKMLREGFSSGYEARIITIHGGIRYVQVNSSAFFKNGQFAGSRNIVLDVTGQTRAEREVKKSEEKYRGIIENMQLGLAEITLNGEILKPYPSFCEMTGYGAEELTGQNGIEILIPENNRDLLKYQLQRRSEGQNGLYELQMRRKDGTLMWALISSTPIKDNKGTVTGGFFIAFDISDRKKMETDLAEAKLIAEHARHSERQFLANMSHEIRTPMNAVIGMTHLLYETNPTQSQKVYLDSLRFAADSLMGIIDNVLDLSKIEAGEMEFEAKAFNLQRLMKSLQRSFQFKLRDKAISVGIEDDPAIGYQVIGDPTRLNQILTNLLGNASKFTETGRIGLSVKLLEDAGGQYLIEFRVMDTGIGIPKDKLNDIFENFKQANVKIARKYGGSGLGLTIVKQMVEMQGGSIRVESTLNKGSVFIFTLPFKKSDSKISETQQEYRIGESRSRHFFKTLSVLVVEDNSMNQKLITKILDIWNCNYVVANDGLEAVEISLQESFDLILMDIHMPEMDGCEATEKIRQNPVNRNRNVPIIALTAAALLEEKKRAVKAGMSDFLTKPFSPEMLEACILQHLNFRVGEHAENEPEDDCGYSSELQIDLKYLFEFSNNDRTFVLDMVDTFLVETSANAERLEQSLRDEDWKNVYKIVHTFKPSFMMLGMTEQHEKAIEIENLINRGDFDKREIAEKISWLAGCAKAACPVLEAMKSQV
jgi:PAS domain S-box-containing protein